MLRLKAKGRASRVGLAAFARCAVQVVACVELHARLRRPDLHHATRRRLVDFSDTSEHSHPSVENEVVVVAVAELQLLVVRADARADCGRAREVEWSSAHAPQLARRDSDSVGRREARGVYGQTVVQNVAAASAREVVVVVLREVDDCRLVCRSRVVNPQLVRVC